MTVKSEECHRWWIGAGEFRDSQRGFGDDSTEYEVAEAAWLAATKATAARCVEICNEKFKEASAAGCLQIAAGDAMCASAIRKKYGLE